MAAPVLPLRARRDRCPGACRPWPAADGLLVRLRLIGGQVSGAQLGSLLEAATTFGDGRIHLTSRANLQVRGFPGAAGQLDPDALSALRRTGLLPAPTHELVRNVLMSPQTGLAGGRADLRPVGQKLDQLLCANQALSGLPGRFLFVLDDGRGDLRERSCDLGLTVLDERTAQLRVGVDDGPVVALSDAAARLIDLADRFVRRRGSGASAAWHVSELDTRLLEPAAPDPRLPQAGPSLPYGEVPGGCHVAVAEDGLDRAAIHALTARSAQLVVTPWRGVLVPTEDP